MLYRVRVGRSAKCRYGKQFLGFGQECDRVHGSLSGQNNLKVTV